MGNVQGVLGATCCVLSQWLHRSGEPLQVASLLRPAEVAVEPLQQAEQHRLAMVPGNWRSQKQSRLTMSLAARLGHHLTVKQSDATRPRRVANHVG